MAISDDTIVLFGASGMLGTDLALQFKEAAQILCPTHKELDVSDERAVFDYLKRNAPSLVINATAYTNVDLAEKETKAAELLNLTTPEGLARSCHELGAKLVHFSTDQVFDGGGNSPWTEEDPVNPLNTYASTKQAGEKAVLRFDGNLVLRVQWLYGKKKDRFAPLKDKQSFTPFSDQFGAPTWTVDVARWTQTLIEKKAQGLFHLSYDDYASWAEVFQFVKEKWGLKLELKPQTTDKVTLPARRPLNARLSNQKLKQFLNEEAIGSWKDSLNQFLG